MKTYKVINPQGYGSSSEDKIKSSFEETGTPYKIVGGEYEGYGNPEYSIIETEATFDSEFIQRIASNATVSVVCNQDGETQ